MYITDIKQKLIGTLNKCESIIKEEYRNVEQRVNNSKIEAEEIWLDRYKKGLDDIVSLEISDNCDSTLTSLNKSFLYILNDIEEYKKELEGLPENVSDSDAKDIVDGFTDYIDKTLSIVGLR